MKLASLDPTGALRTARSFLRPVGWRGVTPELASLEGCLLYERDKTTQQEVVHAITAGIPTKVAGIPATTPELVT